LLEAGIEQDDDTSTETPKTEDAKDNAIMRDQISSYKAQAMSQERFVRSMDEAKALIDSLSRPGSNNIYLNQQIAALRRLEIDIDGLPLFWALGLGRNGGKQGGGEQGNRGQESDGLHENLLSLH